jgi:branched-chain amino acid transport system permease protein
MSALPGQLGRLNEWAGRRRRLLLVVAALLAIAFPFVARLFHLSLAIEVLVFAIFAMSLDLLLGYTGLPSFGHAAFFGLGAYVAAYLSSLNPLALGLTSNLLVTIPAAMLASALAALLIGFFALRKGGIYFLMITLAFAQMLFSIAIRWSGVTGGSDGLSGVPRPTIGIGPLSYEFVSRESYYFLVLICFVIAFLLLRAIVNSPFGWALRGIRENEGRLRALGYNTRRYKLAAFAIAGAFAGLAGLLLVFFFRHASAENLYWTTSGNVMVMLIVGGSGTLVGPILGALVIRLFPLLVSSYVDRWRTLQGLLFIAFVLLAPSGILGWLRPRRAPEPERP